ncbi:MAG: biotin--[acetyl-CoA-carboxylase] ligase [Lachnospiraceae bacterium]|nr:biotin--[acetyl-CoA-carboxylase] ligase [Lachnospiraceae bacterium]
MTDILSSLGIKEHLDEQNKDLNIEIYPILNSTNLTLKEKAASGAPEGTVIIAEEQTMGRGRFGRQFFSPAGTGIYMSMLLRPQLEPSDSTLITTATAVAVSEAIEEVTGASTAIKWINDIWIKKYGSNKYAKICGILTEAALSSGSRYPDYIILGIGINVFEPENGFPAEISGIAASAIGSDRPTKNSNDTSTSLAQHDSSCSHNTRNRIIAAVLNKFMALYPNLTKRTFLDEYRRRSVVLGHKINVIENTLRPDVSFSATAVAIDNDCNLIVELEDGTTEALYSGEISIRL